MFRKIRPKFNIDPNRIALATQLMMPTLSGSEKLLRVMEISVVHGSSTKHFRHSLGRNSSTN